MLKLKQSVRTAISIGTLCAISYYAVYVARHILSTVSPHLVANEVFGTAEETTAFIGSVSSVYFISYAVGQLINGLIGDRIKARYMLSFGLALAGVTNFLFSLLSSNPTAAMVIYGMTGFFLAMIYGPMTKVVAENVDPLYAPRCSLGYNFASFLANPTAGLLAGLLPWQSVFAVSSLLLVVMAVCVFCSFLYFEKKDIVQYDRFRRPETNAGGSIKLLIQHRILTFSLIAILTGIVRTAVNFWRPTYFSQHLGYSPEESAMLVTICGFVGSLNAFVSVFVYEKLNRNLDKTILIMFSASALFFASLYFVEVPILNVILMQLALSANGGASTMLWSRYCPGLRNTGIVSRATGFLDFLSYLGASVSSTLFANAVGSIGWGNLILVWSGLMVCGVLVILPWHKLPKKSKP